MKTETTQPAVFDEDGYMNIDERRNEAVMINSRWKEYVSFFVSFRGASVCLFLTHEQARAIAERLRTLAASSPDSE